MPFLHNSSMGMHGQQLRPSPSWSPVESAREDLAMHVGAHLVAVHLAEVVARVALEAIPGAQKFYSGRVNKFEIAFNKVSQQRTPYACSTADLKEIKAPHRAANVAP